MPIIDLRQQPRHLHQLAQWHQAEWAHLNPGKTLDDRLSRMQLYLNDSDIPVTYVALDEDGSVMGSAAIVENDMSTHPELTPWMASVFVEPSKRRQGVGSALVRHVTAQAGALGLEFIYLFTPDQAPLYASLGWEIIGQELFHGTDVTLMRYPLN